MKKIPLAIDVVNRKFSLMLSGIQLAAIVFAAVLVTLDVLLRALFSKPISGTSEYVGYIMILASFFGLGLCTMDRSHLKVDLIVQNLPAKVQHVIDAVNDVVVCAVGCIMTYAAFNQGAVTFGLKTRGMFSGVPNWPFYYLMGIGYLSVATGAVSLLIQDLLALRKPAVQSEAEKGEDC